MTRVPYQDLDADEREALHTWCRLHDVDHTRVPVDPLIELDPATREWRIELFDQRDGRRFVGPDGHPAKIVVRRAWKADLPWRTE